jgi:glycolate oxidase iron-sulfur subunit
VSHAPSHPPTPLALDADELVACVACGLCLPHCPTYRVTNLEIASPRGRIAAMRAVESGSAPIDAAFERAMEECVQCRGCEAACPSGVPFGHLMEGARAALASDRSTRSRAPRGRRAVEYVGYRWVLPHRVLLRIMTWLTWLGQRLGLVPKRLGVPRLRARDLRPKLDAPVGDTTTDIWLFTGCVMDAWERPVHAAVLRVLRACGRSVSVPRRGADCCGALHVHAGRRDEARALARRVIAAMPGDAPIAVDSAGCGAALRDYGHLLGTPEAAAFAARVRDFSELAVECGAPSHLRVTGRTVVVQDPCHLRHVQKAHGAVRALLGGAYELRETADDGLCCGSGGAYSALEPELALPIRARKSESLRTAGATVHHGSPRTAGDADVVVCSANPGCTFHLAAAGFTVRHPAQLAADALED